MKKGLLLIVLLALFGMTNAQDEWNIIHPIPPYGDHKDVAFVSGEKGWIVGTKGIIKFTEDGGNSWQIQYHNPERAFWGVFFLDEEEGWAVGWNSIYHTSDGGINWEAQNRPPFYGSLMDVYFVNKDTGWVVGTYKTILKTVNGGESWKKISNAIIGDYWLSGVVFSDAEHGCAVGEKESDEGVILITSDGGENWTEVSPEGSKAFVSVETVDSASYWVCGRVGELRKSTDGGNTWTKLNMDYRSFNDIHFTDKNTGMLLEYNRMTFTFDGGETWDSSVYINTSISQVRFSVGDDSTIFTIGGASTTFRSVDGGSSWEKLGGGVPSRMNQICFFNPLDGFAAPQYSTPGSLLRTSDGGASWTRDTLIENGPYYMVRINGQSGYVLNLEPQMMKTSNGGENWVLLDLPPYNGWYNDLQFVNENTGYLCARESTLYKTINGGASWSKLTFSQEYDFKFLYFLNEETGWLVDELTNKILRTTSGGNSWTFSNLWDGDEALEPTSIFFINEDKGFATTKEGVVFKSEDGGNNWTEFYTFQSGYKSEILFTTSTEGWYRGGWRVYHTFDGGDTWENEQDLGETLFSMFFLDKNTGWLGGDHGLVATYASTVGTGEGKKARSMVSVFPNPAEGMIEVVVPNKSEQILKLTVYDVRGRKIKQLSKLHSGNQFTLNVAGLKSGLYFLDLETDSGRYLARFVRK